MRSASKRPCYVLLWVLCVLLCVVCCMLYVFVRCASLCVVVRRCVVWCGVVCVCCCVVCVCCCVLCVVVVVCRVLCVVCCVCCCVLLVLLVLLVVVCWCSCCCRCRCCCVVVVSLLLLCRCCVWVSLHLSRFLSVCQSVCQSFSPYLLLSFCFSVFRFFCRSAALSPCRSVPLCPPVYLSSGLFCDCVVPSLCSAVVPCSLVPSFRRSVFHSFTLISVFLCMILLCLSCVGCCSSCVFHHLFLSPAGSNPSDLQFVWCHCLSRIVELGKSFIHSHPGDSFWGMSLSPFHRFDSLLLVLSVRSQVTTVLFTKTVDGLPAPCLHQRRSTVGTTRTSTWARCCRVFWRRHRRSCCRGGNQRQLARKVCMLRRMMQSSRQ